MPNPVETKDYNLNNKKDRKPRSPAQFILSKFFLLIEMECKQILVSSVRQQSRVDPNFIPLCKYFWYNIEPGACYK